MFLDRQMLAHLDAIELHAKQVRAGIESGDYQDLHAVAMVKHAEELGPKHEWCSTYFTS